MSISIRILARFFMRLKGETIEMCWIYDRKCFDKRARVRIAKEDIPVFKVVKSLPTETGFPKNFENCCINSYFRDYQWDRDGKFLLYENSLTEKLPSYASSIYAGFHSYGSSCVLETYRNIGMAEALHDALHDWLSESDGPDNSAHKYIRSVMNSKKVPVKCNDCNYDAVAVYSPVNAKSKSCLLTYYEASVSANGSTSFVSAKPLIMKCIIPKSCRYYVNMRREYVSDKIMPVKLVKAIHYK